jgi:hypothetical protein
MANEVTINATLAYDDAISSDSMQIVDRVVTVSTTKFTKLIQSIGITEEAIQLGEVSTLGYAMFRNLDPTNFVELRVATGGAKFARLDPDTSSNGKGGCALLRLGSGAQVPYAIADTAPCRIEIIIISS